MSELLELLQSNYRELEFLADSPLAPFTAVKIGGPAEVLVTIDSSETLIDLVRFCKRNAIPVTILGWGANTLIADRGIRGLVIRNVTKELEISEDRAAPSANSSIDIAPRHAVTSPDQSFSTLDYQETPGTARVRVTVASGWPLASLIPTLLARSITGLQWYSRIPATIGGAVVNNIHGGTHFLSEVIESVDVLTLEGDGERLTPQECEFDYDYSRFHHSQEIITSVSLLLWKGDVDKARATVGQWAKLKSNQPQHSLGCTFRNISAEVQKEHNLPTPSTGYLIDQVLELKGTRIGGAQISQKHAAFIENVADATAQDYLDLSLLIARHAREQLGIKLVPEIFFRGFASSELQELAQTNSL